MKVQNQVVNNADTGKRLDLYVGEMLGCASLTRNHIQNMITLGEILVNALPCTKGYSVKAGDLVTVVLSPLKETEILPQNIPLDIVYEDECLIVVNKKKGMVVHPAPGHPDKTLVNALLFHCGNSLSGINGVARPGIVHRIDKDTSGLLVVAKDDGSHNFLAKQLEQHSITREYLAVVHGKFKENTGTVAAPIGRSERDRKKYTVTLHNGKHAVTHYTVLDQMEEFALVSLRLETGRTHQIRVHMAHIGHPVAGDLIYGSKFGIKELGGQCLHAAVLGFIHPKTGGYIAFRAAIPEYFKDFVKKRGGDMRGAEDQGFAGSDRY